MKRPRTEAPSAHVRLRAYLPAPARVELIYQPAGQRALRSALFLALFWGAIPFLLWLPPHYPWVVSALAAGAFLAHREWMGRYRVSSFAGLCPRCHHPLSLAPDRAISLPHTLTCYHCHFEPELEVRFEEPDGTAEQEPEHHAPECTGRWALRWLADEPFLVCDRCLGHRPASAAARARADAENQRADLLEQLTREGRSIL